MALAPGTKLGPYETKSLLGAGGMGEVYRARDTRLGRDVALKILPLHLSSHPDLKERFDREARAISSLNHARICTLHDVGHQDGVDFLVMEFLEGQSLADRLKKGPLPLKEVLKIGMEVCEALDVAHRAGITHRDLKPGNIMLTASGAKLMDFGLAKAGIAGAEIVPANAPLLSAAKTMSHIGPGSPLTTAGQVLGTIQYMSPEQLEGKPADVRSDIFSLGAVLYEMTAGKRPFEGQSQISVASAILEKNPEPISAIQPLTPRMFERVVSTCLEKNPDDRFQSARDVRLELKWVGEQGIQAAPVAAVPATKKLSSIVPWAIAGILVCALVGAILLFRREQVQPVYTNVTYGLGRLQSARFSHDGQTIVYGGEWEGGSPLVKVARVGSPESRSLDLPSGAVAGISSADKLAVLVGCEPVFIIDCGGTLSTADLAGGAPRAIAEHVAYADWSPDGKDLAISVFSATGARLEFPPGHVVYEQKTGWFGHPRFSPDGRMIAFENHATAGNDVGSVDVVDLDGNKRTLLPENVSLEGIAWRPDGKEVWCAASSNGGWADTIYGLTLSGKKRAILTMPYLRLHDIAKDGRALVSHEVWRRQLIGFFPGDKSEHFYSWLDDTVQTGITSDGRMISFGEGGEVYGIYNDFMAYYRPTDGSPAVFWGPGVVTISPDGKWLLTTSATSHKLQLQPVGPGEAKDLPAPGVVTFDHAAWSADGRVVAYEGQTDRNEWNIYWQKIEGGSPVLVKTNGRFGRPILSTDGGIIAASDGQTGVSLYRAGNSQPTPLEGTSPNEFALRFTADGKSLLVIDSGEASAATFLVDLASGRRRLWRNLDTRRVGSAITGFVITPDLKYYAYSSPRYASDLYIVDNLH